MISGTDTLAQSSEERIVFDLSQLNKLKPNTASLGLRVQRKSQKKLKDLDGSQKRLTKLSKSSKKSKDKSSKQNLTLDHRDVTNSDLIIVDSDQGPKKGKTGKC